MLRKKKQAVILGGMFSLLFSLFASSCASFANLLFRKNGETTSSPNVYLTIYYLSSLLCAIFIFQIWNKTFNPAALFLGSTVGFLNIGLMLATAYALTQGPSGLTFAFQNASAIFPGFILFLLFGTPLGFSFTLLQGVGLILVLVGLFNGAQSGEAKNFKQWLRVAMLCFALQVLALTLIQGRCILFDCSKLPPFWNHFALTPQDDGWFALGQFGTASLFQFLLAFREAKTIPSRSITLGLCAGAANFGSTFLLLLATKVALPETKGLLFPFFCVGNILLCNVWAWKLYKEKFNWTSNALCTAGILIGIL